MSIPKQPKKKYNEHVNGIFGEFGAGGKHRVRYIQTNLDVAGLESVKMVAELAESEKWPIRELFQREVDEGRVKRDIVPYLTNENQVKFFNPLTFVLLNKDGKNIGAMPRLEEKSFGGKSSEADDGWQKYYEMDEVFRLKHSGRSDGYAELEWNSKKAAVVAIDGQHRLLALNKMDRSKISQWRIPVVILLISPEGKGQTGRITDSVRKLFLYINKEAHQPSEKRKIILDEENVNEMCVQELLQNGRKSGGIPLLAYDWRDTETNMAVPDEEDSKILHSYTVFSAEYMRDWLTQYILGENYWPYQRDILGIAPEKHALYKKFKRNPGKVSLSEKHADDIRECFRARVMPGITHFVREFAPYRDYIGLIEKIYKEADEYEKQALDHICFGGTAINDADPWDVGEIKKAVVKVMKRLSLYIKNDMPPVLVKLDVGGFGVFYTFGELYYLLGYSNFVEYSKSAALAFNKAWDMPGKHGLEKILSIKGKDPQSIFHHIIFDHSGRIKNNRLGTAHKGLGALITLVVLKHWGKIDEAKKNAAAKTHLSLLRKSLERGYKKQLIDADTAPADERDNKKIAKDAAKLAKNQIGRIQKAYDFSGLETDEDVEANAD